MSLTNRWCFTGVMLMAGLAGCQQVAQQSSEQSLEQSAAESGRASLDSSSASSDSEAAEDEQARSTYRRDVRAYTVAFLQDTEDPDTDAGLAFVRGIGRIAEAHGITDWESCPDSRDAIETAIAEQGLDEPKAGWLRDRIGGSVSEHED